MNEIDRALELAMQGYVAEDALNRAEREAKDEVLYPQVKVRLVGEDGNAFAIMARVTRAMKKAGLSQEVCDEYMAEAMSGDYDNLLYITTRWVEMAPPMVCSGCEMSECECYDTHEYLGWGYGT